jgi:hypothetical protein
MTTTLMGQWVIAVVVAAKAGRVMKKVELQQLQLVGVGAWQVVVVEEVVPEVLSPQNQCGFQRQPRPTRSHVMSPRLPFSPIHLVLTFLNSQQQSHLPTRHVQLNVHAQMTWQVGVWRNASMSRHVQTHPVSVNAWRLPRASL